MLDNFSSITSKSYFSSFQFEKLLTFLRSFLIGNLVLVVLISVYCGIYMTRNLMPHEQIRDQITLAAEKGLISVDATGRAPAGWGVDHATECLTLGLGLDKGGLGKQLSDKFVTSKTDFNPCAGLLQHSSSQNTDTITESYARYWHGHAVISQWLIYFLGLPIFRNLLWIVALILLLLNYRAIEKIRNEGNSFPKYFSFLLLSPYVAFGDWADVYGSIPHILANIGCMGISLLFFKHIGNKNNPQLYLSGIILGSIYNFMLFMLSPQSIPIMLLTWVLLPRIISGKNIRDEFTKFTCFFTGILTGYCLTWISKWIIVSQLTDINIFQNVFGQALHRTSIDQANLSSGVSSHIDFVSGAPVYVQSLIANMSALGIHVADPRYSSKYYFFTLGFVSLIICARKIQGFFLLEKSERNQILKYFRVLFLATSFLFLWYSILGQHSFDHATYTFRSLAILSGGYLAVVSLIPRINRSDL
jgi:hypothetical protein